MNLDELKLDFFMVMRRYLDDIVLIERDVAVNTMVRPIDVDFLLTFGPIKIVIRVRDFDKRGRRPINLREWEVAAMLGSGIDVVYDFRPKDVDAHMIDCLYVIVAFNPEIFTERGIVNIHSQISEDARDYRTLTADKESVSITYYSQPLIDGLPDMIWLFHHDQRMKARAFWKDLLTYILEYPSNDFSSIEKARNKALGRHQDWAVGADLDPNGDDSEEKSDQGGIRYEI